MLTSPPPTTPSSHAAGPRWLPWTPALALALTAATQIRFMILDPRLPRDLCLCYQPVVGLTRLLDGEAPGDVAEIAGTVGGSTGWYALLQAVALWAIGRGPHVVQALDLGWVLAVIGLASLVARRIGGGWAAAVAATLLAAMPGLVVEGRLGWIHVPEAALALAGLLAWLADPELARRRTIVAMGLAGAAAITLRPSGLVWAGSLVLPLAWTARRHWEERALRLVALAGAWGLAATVPLTGLGEYLGSKASARSRYSEAVPELAQQISVALGPVALLACALAVPAGIWALLRRRPSGAPAVALGLLLAWVVGALFLVFLFLAGIDNHTAALPAAAILAGWALASGAPRPGLALAASALLLHLVAQWMPTPGPGSAWWRAPVLRQYPIGPSVLNYAVPYPFYGEPQVRTLVDAVCGQDVGPRGCAIAADQGLYVPYGEEPGRLELFLAREERVQLLPVRQVEAEHPPKVNALVEFTCGERDAQWRARWPQTTAARAALVEQGGLQPVWSSEVAPGCFVWWLTPGGQALHPSLLPASGRPGPEVERARGGAGPAPR